jgi:hypothetical protein
MPDLGGNQLGVTLRHSCRHAMTGEYDQPDPGSQIDRRFRSPDPLATPFTDNIKRTDPVRRQLMTAEEVH